MVNYIQILTGTKGRKKKQESSPRLVNTVEHSGRFCLIMVQNLSIKVPLHICAIEFIFINLFYIVQVIFHFLLENQSPFAYQILYQSFIPKIGDAIFGQNFTVLTSTEVPQPIWLQQPSCAAYLGFIDPQIGMSQNGTGVFSLM